MRRTFAAALLTLFIWSGIVSADPKCYLDFADAAGTATLDELVIASKDTDPARRHRAFAELLGREHPVAFDILYLHARLDQAFVADNRGAMAAAIVGSHYVSKPEAQQAFVDLWRQIGGQAEQRAIALNVWTRCYAPRPSRLRPWIMSREAEGLLTEHLSPEDRQVLVERQVLSAEPDHAIVGEQDHPTANTPVAPDGLEARIKKFSGIGDAALIDELVELARTTRTDGDGADKVDLLLAQAIRQVREHGESHDGGWAQVMEDAAQPWRLVGAVKHVAMRVARPPGRSHQAAEDLCVAFIKDQAAVWKAGLDGDPSAPKTKHAQQSLRLASATAELLASHTPQGYVRDRRPARLPGYEELPGTIAPYVADIRAREGHRDAQQYLRDRFAVAAAALLELDERRRAAIAEHRRDDVRAHQAAISAAFGELLPFVALADHGRIALVPLRKRLVDAASDTPGVGPTLFLAAVSRSGSPSEREKHRVVGSKTEEINRIKADLAAGKGDFDMFLARMNSMNAMDDPEIYDAYREVRAKGVKPANKRLVAKMLAYHGLEADAAQVSWMWLDTNVAVLELVVSCIENRGYTDVLAELVGEYFNTSDARRRILISRAAYGMATPQDIPWCLRVVCSEREPELARVLALGAVLQVRQRNPRAEGLTWGDEKTLENGGIYVQVIKDVADPRVQP